MANKDLLTIKIQLDAKLESKISVHLLILDAQTQDELFNGKLSYENLDIATIFEKLDDVISATLSSYGDKYGS